MMKSQKTEDRPHDRLRDEVVEAIPALRAYAWSLTRNQSDADDLVQETLLKALRHLEKFEPGSRLRAWLFTIQRNTFLSGLKVAQREPTGVDDCAPIAPASQPTQEWTVRGRELMNAVGRLPPHYREVLVLVVMLGESYETAAQLCQITLGTVKSRVNRARRMVIEDLGDDRL